MNFLPFITDAIPVVELPAKGSRTTSPLLVLERTMRFNRSKGFYASLRDEKIFNTPKIYITRTGNPFKAFLDKECYASNNFFSLQVADYSKNSLEELKVFLPLIISNIAQYFIRTFAAPRLGNIFVETKMIHLLKFRIPDLTFEEKNLIRNQVDKILSIMNERDYSKNSTKQAKVREYEKQIDKMVYKLYGFTKEEIQIIEGNGRFDSSV